MKEIYIQFRDFFVSLRLTVVLLAFSIVLVFAATLDQVNLGVWGVQEKYFRSLFVLWNVGSVPVPVFPGGYLIGGLLFLNLLAAHFYRFKFAWRKSGIFLTHVGLIMLLVGELLTGLMQEDFQMVLQEGETVNYSESFRENELAIIDTTDPEIDDVVAIPEELLARGETIQHPKLPFRVVTRGYYQHSMLQMRSEDATSTSPATVGVGPQIVATPLAPTYRDDERNTPTAFVELLGSDGSLGTFLVSTNLSVPQTFSYAGRDWRIELRIAREYKPFSVTLLQVRHDIYPGTDIPKNFSSRVRVNTPDGADDREVLIYMNNPMRYGGLTFYQYQMNAANGLSVLQVVRNPSWLLPYIACTLMFGGLLIQFGIHLFGFVKRRYRKAVTSA